MKKLPLLILSLFCFNIQANSTTILTLRNMFTGNPVAIPANTIIQGMVTSDFTSGNFVAQNLYIQDNTGGIVVRFLAAHSFALGLTLTIDVSGLTLTDFNDLVEVDSVPLANAMISGSVIITPAVVTTADILNNMNGNVDSWESTLVVLQNVTISGANGTYQGSDTITDATGSLVLFTRSAATFAAVPLPSGTVNITGVISDYQTLPELIIRNLADVQQGNNIHENTVSPPFFLVSSNPVHGIIKIKSGVPVSSGVVYSITDMNGRIFSNGLLYVDRGSGIASVDIGNLNKGIYVLSLSQSGKMQLLKIIVE